MATQHNFRIKNGLEVAGTERISSAGAITPQSLTVTADASVGGNLTITGNLVVNGSTTTIDTATLSVEDLNITVASGAGNSSAADGAGLTIAGASAIFAWDHAQGAMTLNKEFRLDNNKGLFFRNSSSNGTLGFKADTSDNITFRQNGQWDRLVIKNDGVDIAGNIYTPNNISSGFASTLKGYFYESTVDQNGGGKPSSVLGLAANIDSRGEGPSIDFNAIWSAAAGYQQDNWNEGWTVGRIAGVYDSAGLDTGALAFYTQTSGSSGGASSASLTEKMRLDSSGALNVNNLIRVGFTSGNQGSSAEILSVYSAGSGHARFTNAHDSYSPVYIKNTSSTAGTVQPFMVFQDGGGNRGNFGLKKDTAGLYVNGHGGINLSTGSGGVGATPSLVIDSTGRVGIGTESPVEKVHVHNSSSTGSQIQFTDTGTGSSAPNGFRVGYNGSVGQLWLFENADIRFATNNVERLRLNQYGDVSIDDTLRFKSTSSDVGYRFNLGFIRGGSGGYNHIKTDLPSNGNKMMKFEYDGWTYSGTNYHESVTFYTYAGQTGSPYNLSYADWGSGGGIANVYYSSDSKVVIVIQAHVSYTGGFLYAQCGRGHYVTDIQILASGSNSTTSGVF